jgi:hypothetical protein
MRTSQRIAQKKLEIAQALSSKPKSQPIKKEKTEIATKASKILKKKNEKKPIFACERFSTSVSDSEDFILTASQSEDEEMTSLWDNSQLGIGKFFSSVTYLKVTDIQGNKVTVMNKRGESWIMSKNLLAKEWWAADHYSKEVKCSMTELASLIE